MKRPLLALICMCSFACDSATQVPSAPPEPTLTDPSGLATVAYSDLPNRGLFNRRLQLSGDQNLLGEPDCVALNGDWNDKRNLCTLTEDVVGGIQLGPGIELNCDGHTILGDGGGIGVRAADDSRVSNCVIAPVDSEAPLGAGIFVNGASGFSCEHCRIDLSEFSVFSVGGVGNTFSRSEFGSPFADFLGTDNRYEWIKFLPPEPFPFPFPEYAGLFVSPSGLDIEYSQFPGLKEWGLVVIDPTDFIAGHNWFDGGFGGMILDGTGGNLLIQGNRFSNMDLPVQIAVDGAGFLVLDNEFRDTGGSQIGTFPGQISRGHFYLFNSFMDGRDTDNDFRDMGAVFDGLQDLVFGFNTIQGSVNNGVFASGFFLPMPPPPPSDDPLVPSDRSVHFLWNSVRDNGGHGLFFESETEKSAWVWLNDFRGNDGFQVYIVEPWEYGAPTNDGFIGNYYGAQGFFPAITSNATDICPLDHPVPGSSLEAQLRNSLQAFEGEPFPGMLELIKSWNLDQPGEIPAFNPNLSFPMYRCIE